MNNCIALCGFVLDPMLSFLYLVLLRQHPLVTSSHKSYSKLAIGEKTNAFILYPVKPSRPSVCAAPQRQNDSDTKGNTSSVITIVQKRASDDDSL